MTLWYWWITALEMDMKLLYEAAGVFLLQEPLRKIQTHVMVSDPVSDLQAGGSDAGGCNITKPGFVLICCDTHTSDWTNKWFNWWLQHLVFVVLFFLQYFFCMIFLKIIHVFYYFTPAGGHFSLDFRFLMGKEHFLLSSEFFFSCFIPCHAKWWLRKC